MTLVILVLAFGALVAAGIPLLLGLTAVMAALGLTALLSHLLHVDESINSVILLIGLAVGIDYSLFYLRRYREERARGRSPAAALEVAAATSGRAVLVSGLTVMTAMAGMFLMGTRVFQGFGVGHGARRRDRARRLAHGAAGAALEARRPRSTAAGSRSLRRIDGRDGESRFWGSDRRGRAASTALVGRARGRAAGRPRRFPRSGCTPRTPGVQGLPRDLPVMKVYDRAQKAFPGGPLPAIVAVSAPDVTTPPVTAGDRRAQARRARDRPDAGADQRRHQPVAASGPRADPARGRGHGQARRTARSTRCAAR